MSFFDLQAAWLWITVLVSIHAVCNRSSPSILSENIGQDESLLFEMCQMGSNECLSFYVAKVSVYTHKARKHREDALRFQKPRL